MNRDQFVILICFITAIAIYLHVDHNKLDSKLSDMVKELNKYRAVESQGRCYKLELPKDFGVAEDE